MAIDKDAAKQAAKEKALKAKESAIARKKKKENPPPIFVDMDSVDFTGDYEKDAEIELSETLKGFKARAKAEADRFKIATDTEYWACLCFQTREQKEFFLKALSLIDIGDKYLDGQEVARVLGVELPNANVPYNTSERVDKAWLEFME